MLTKILILAGAAIAVVLMVAKQLRPLVGPPRPPAAPPRPAPEDTVQCPACGAWHLAGEPCLCGHSSRD